MSSSAAQVHPLQPSCVYGKTLPLKVQFASQVRWLQQLAALPGVPEVPAFGGEADALLNDLAANFSVADAQEVKEVRLTARMELMRASTDWR